MIDALAKKITTHPKTVVLISLLLMIPAFLGVIFTPVNYDILSYLPEELDSVKGLSVLDEEFKEASMAIIVMDSLSQNDMKSLEKNIAKIDNVSKVMWLGALGDSPFPITMLPDSVASMLFSKDGSSTLMIVQFSSSAGDNATLDSIAKIKLLLNKQSLLSGMSAMTQDMSTMMNDEIPLYVSIAVILVLIALGLTMESFASPVILLISLGISIVYNMGTNFIFGEISFITQAIAAVLQLAVTMDYSIFLMDRYAEEKPKYRTRQTAMAKAIKGTFSSLLGSSFTTVFGFLALCFMRLTLGRDIGIVMAKGVFLGIFSVVVILPAWLLICEGFIQKTKHKSLIPSFSGLNKITVKLRKVIAILFVIITIPAWYGQKNVEKYYNMMDAMPESMDSIAAMNVLKEDFNMASIHFVITSDELSDNQTLTLTEKISELDGISGVLSLQSMLGTALSPSILPESFTSMLRSGGYQLIMVTSIYPPASDECNAQIEAINSIIKTYDSGGALSGEGPMYKDLIEITDEDFLTTSIISTAAIFILIAIIFKSISIPFILVLSIQLAIWINLAISYYSGEVICFITPTIISCVQLGATVDYAILLATRYQEEIRKGIDKKEAMLIAANQSHKSIFQSALVFFAATFGVGFVCDIDIVRSMCMMLARGSVISALMIILFLTPVLVVCEGLINKTTLGWRIPVNATKLLPADKGKRNSESKTEKTAKKNKKRVHSQKVKYYGVTPVPKELVAKKLDNDSATKIQMAMQQTEQKPSDSEQQNTSNKI